MPGIVAPGGPVRPLLLLVPSGLSERPRPVPRSRSGRAATALELAHTPALDRLAARAELTRVQTVPSGLSVRAETALATLLGAPPAADPPGPLLDAAAVDLDPPEGGAAWRFDLHRGGAPWEPVEPQRLARDLTHAAGTPVRHLRGHRFLLVGPAEWGVGPGRLSRRRRGVWGDLARAVDRMLPRRVQPVVWGEPRPSGLRRVALDRPLVTVARQGTRACGVARLVGSGLAAVSDEPMLRSVVHRRLVAEGTSQLDDDRAGVVVLHVDTLRWAGSDRDGKTQALEAFDRDLLAPLLAAARDRHAGVWVCPDHTLDPATASPCRDPVPACWTPDAAGAGGVPQLVRLTERVLDPGPMADGATLLRTFVRLLDTAAA